MSYDWIIGGAGLLSALELILLFQPRWMLRMVQALSSAVVYFVETPNPGWP